MSKMVSITADEETSISSGRICKVLHLSFLEYGLPVYSYHGVRVSVAVKRM